MNADIILLNSTSTFDTERIRIYNYNVIQRNALTERNAGIAIAIRSNIKYRPLDDFADDILGIEIDTTKGPISILTCYFPPRRGYILAGELENILQLPRPVYVIGDMNANMPFMGYRRYNNNGRILKRLIEANKIRHLGPDFRTLVHVEGRPDVVCSNRAAFLNTAIERGELTSSDHFPLVVRISTKPIIKTTAEKPNYNNVDWNIFKTRVEEKIAQENERYGLNNEDRVDTNQLDIMFGNWMNILINTMSDVIPKTRRTFYVHPKTSDFLQLLMISYGNLKRKNYWTREDIERLGEIQQDLKNENLRLYREAWDNKIDKLNRIHKDSAKFWRGVSQLMGNTRNSEEYVVDSSRNNERVFAANEKEKIYRRIWKVIFSIPEEENENFDQNNERIVKEYLQRNIDRVRPYEYADLNRLEAENPLTRPVTAEDVVTIINSFKNKAPGISGVGRRILKELPRVAIERFALLTNLMISMGYYSIIFKNGLLVFTQKPGKDPKFPENYRPITLLEVPGKIIERILDNRMRRFCTDNNLFNTHQYGFRRGLGTDIAIATAYEKIAINQREKQHCNVICRDVAKAFDRVWVEGLQYKILQTEMPDILQKSLCSYVSNRTVQIKIDGFVGPKFELSAGVPQGSILSPTLFIFYTNDTPPPIHEESCDILFADDVTQVIEFRGRDREELAVRSEMEITRVNEYEKKWKIKTNNNKFKMIPASKTAPYPISVEDENLNFTTDVNILGLTLTRTGCQKHLGAKIRSAKGQLLKLRRFEHLNPSLIIRLYLTLVRSIIEYPPIPNGLLAKNNLLKLQRLQNRALKLAVRRTDDRYMTLKDIHEKYNIQAINVRLDTRFRRTWDKM